MISHFPLKYLWRCCISCWEKLESYHYLSEEFKCCKISFVAGKIKCSMLDDKVNGLNTRVKLARSCQYVVMPSMLLMHQLISLFIKKETVMKLLLRKSTGLLHCSCNPFMFLRMESEKKLLLLHYAIFAFLPKIKKQFQHLLELDCWYLLLIHAHMPFMSF